MFADGSRDKDESIQVKLGSCLQGLHKIAGKIKAKQFKAGTRSGRRSPVEMERAERSVSEIEDVKI